MPIRPELRAHYRTPEWEAAKAAVRERAKGRCEWCGKPENRWVAVTRDGTGRWNELIARALPLSGIAVAVRGFVAALKRSEQKAWRLGWHSPKTTRWSEIPASEASLSSSEPPPTRGRIWFINRPLSFAHLDHTPGNDDPANIRAWCEGCHLRYDGPYHKRMREERKDRARPILAALMADIDEQMAGVDAMRRAAEKVFGGDEDREVLRAILHGSTAVFKLGG